MFTLTCKVSEVFATQVEVIDAVDFNSEDILDIREEVREHSDAISQNSKQNREIMKILRKVNERLDKIERKQLELSAEVRAKGIVINGLTETTSDTPIVQAFNFLKNIDDSLKQEEIDVAYRVGVTDNKSEEQSARSLVVIFYGHSKKRDIMNLKTNLKKHVDYHKVFVNDDLPTEMRQHRDEMREISNYAKENGYNSKVSGNKLHVNGRTFQHHELNLLPKDILLEKIRTWRRGDGIAFQGETSCLSNFFPCEIRMWGHVFNCSEQAYQYLKCITCEKEDTAHQIMLLSMPREIKAKGDKTETTSKWEYQKLTKMEEIVTAKFSQNPELGKNSVIPETAPSMRLQPINFGDVDSV